MNKKFKKRYLLAAIFLLATIALAAAVVYLSYTQTLTITPVKQLTPGAATASWTAYVNEVDQNLYVPSGAAASDLDTSNSSTYAFSVVTDANKVCAVKIELATALSSSDFGKFDITVLSWSGSAWTPATLYNAATGSTTKAALNGLTSADTVFIHQDADVAATYYLVKVVYSYNLVDTTSPYTVDFTYTPLPQDSF